MSQSHISIIVPAYNRAWSIERAITSVLHQTSHDWELVIVDDGSTDTTQEVVAKYLSDSRVRYFKKEHAGVGAARNFGIVQAHNELVTFLDSDDEFVPDAIREMQKDAQLLEGQDAVSVVLYLARKARARWYQDTRLFDGERIDYKSTVTGRWPLVETVQLCRKDTFKQFLFPVIPGGHETILWHSLLKYKGPGLVRTKILRIYHTEHSSRLTSASSVVERARTMPALYEIFLEEFGKDYETWNPKQLAYFYMEKGIFEITDGKLREGRASIRNGARFDKRKIPLAVLVFSMSILPKTVFAKFAQLRQFVKEVLVDIRGGGL